MKRILILTSLLCTACGQQRPAAPTAAEQRQLDEADAMLNQLGNDSRSATPNKP